MLMVCTWGRVAGGYTTGRGQCVRYCAYIRYLKTCPLCSSLRTPGGTCRPGRPRSGRACVAREPAVREGVTASCQSVRTSPALRLHLQVVPRKYGGPLSATTCRRGRLWRGWGKRKNRERRAGGLLRLGSFSLPLRPRFASPASLCPGFPRRGRVGAVPRPPSGAMRSGEPATRYYSTTLPRSLSPRPRSGPHVVPRRGRRRIGQELACSRRPMHCSAPTKIRVPSSSSPHPLSYPLSPLPLTSRPGAKP